jgi:hypothetical protein
VHCALGIGQWAARTGTCQVRVDPRRFLNFFPAYKNGMHYLVPEYSLVYDRKYGLTYFICYVTFRVY